MATPTPTTDMIARLRRMTAEPLTSDTYTQGDLQAVIERYPVLDANGTEPDDYGWLGAWDLNRAAADVWDEKASLLATDFDFAADGGDYTVHVVVGIDPDGRMYLLDLWRKQASSDVWVEAFCDLVLRWKPMGWAEEQGQIRAGIGPYLDKRCIERKAFVYREPFPTRGDKAVRAQSIRGRMALSGLYIQENALWFPALRSELLSFPAGKHDDQVDALGLVGQLLDKMLAGDAPKKRPVKEDQSGYSERENNDDDNLWMVS